MQLGQIEIEVNNGDIKKLTMNQKTAEQIAIFALGHKSATQRNYSKSRMPDRYLAVDLGKTFLSEKDYKMAAICSMEQFLVLTRRKVRELVGIEI